MKSLLALFYAVAARKFDFAELRILRVFESIKLIKYSNFSREFRKWFCSLNKFVIFLLKIQNTRQERAINIMLECYWWNIGAHFVGKFAFSREWPFLRNQISLFRKWFEFPRGRCIPFINQRFFFQIKKTFRESFFFGM